MAPEELAQSTRAWWANISPANIERRGIRHAVAVHDGVTRGVMVMGNWTRRGTRRAFAATPLTVGPVYDEWVGPLGRRVPFARGSQSPVTYSTRDLPGAYGRCEWQALAWLCRLRECVWPATGHSGALAVESQCSSYFVY